MSIQKTNSALLPAGFEDLLPPDAGAEYEAIGKMMAVFERFGYERVKPPIAEFEESLLALGSGEAIAADTFRVMDPESRRMMALRSDITAQIARIAVSRLSEEQRPLRLTYANDVIRTRGSQHRTQRQFTQVGCEMVGADAALSDVEVVVVALKALVELDMPKVTIDFSCPKIFDAVMKAAGGGQDIDAVRSKVSGAPARAFAAMDDLELDMDARAYLKRLQDVVTGVEDALAELSLTDKVSVTVDPLETQGFEYHSGVAFTLFAHDVSGEIGRGGRYDIYQDDQPFESAAGFTFYMDTIRQALGRVERSDVKSVPADASWADVDAYQSEGFIVKRDIK